MSDVFGRSIALFAIAGCFACTPHIEPSSQTGSISAPAEPGPETPALNLAMIESIESRIVMPQCDEETARFDDACGAPLASYVRYYAATHTQNTRRIDAVFLFGPRSSLDEARFEAYRVSGSDSVYLLPGSALLPLVMDGGCAIVTASFYLDERAWSSMSNPGQNLALPSIVAACNGYA